MNGRIVYIPRWVFHVAGYAAITVLVYFIPLIGVPSDHQCANEYLIVCGTNGIILTLTSDHKWHLVVLNNRKDTLYCDEGVWWRDVYYRDRLGLEKVVYFQFYHSGSPGSLVFNKYDDVAPFHGFDPKPVLSFPLGSHVATLQVHKPLFQDVVIDNPTEFCAGGL